MRSADHCTFWEKLYIGIPFCISRKEVMISEDDVVDALDARPLGQSVASGRQPTTRLDINTVITRIYDDNDYPLVYIKGSIYSFSRFTIVRTGNLVEIKYYQW